MADLAKKPFRWKLWFPIFIALITLAVAVALFGPRFYRSWKLKRLVAAAQSSFAAGNTPEAMVLAGRILQIDPANSPAFRLVAEAEEAVGNPESIEWRERLVGMNPNSFEDRIAYARAALLYRSGSVAAQALANADESMRKRPEYLEIVGDIALRFNDREKAEKNFSEAALLDPQNQRYTLKLATIRVQAADQPTQRAGLEAFEKLATKSEFRLESLRGLVRGYAAVEDWARAMASAEELIREPKAGFGDKLLRLSVLIKLEDPKAAGELHDLQEVAREDEVSASLLVTWMQNHGKSAEGVAWAEKLPREVRARPRVGVALAACLVAIKDWPSLENLLTGADWGRLNYLRSMFSACLHREKGDKLLFRGFWESALTAGRADPQILLTIGKIAADWGWNDVREEFLWAASEVPQLRWALTELRAKFIEDSDTEKLHRLMSRIVELDQNDLAARNNLAMLDLFLGRDAHFALRLAESLHKTEPQNSAYTSTLAFAQLRSGEPELALATIREIPPEALEKPENAGIYGLILEGNSQPSEAREYLGKAKKGMRFKEEEKMITEALLRLAGQN